MQPQSVQPGQPIPTVSELIEEQNARRAFLDQVGVYFIRDINDVEAERFAKSMIVIASNLKRMGGQRRITVYINSGGGSMGAGFAMMEMMYKVKRDYLIPVDTVVLGYAYSMGAIIAQAGDRRSMGFFSTMMLHSGQWTVVGEDERIFTDYQKLATTYKQKIGELFYRRTGTHTPRWWTNFVYSGRDRFLSATECLKLHLVDEVCEFDTCYILPPDEQARLP
ncbi:MAG: ATP-dependent Clp protease proteolytic subunit [Chloroflexota bacterium]|nr:ATP-dependent Clp protease proteolytic subunit [Chloroflexota bacterium]